MPDHPVIATAQRFRAATLAREREAANRLVQTYGRAYTRFGDSIKTLSEMVGKLDNPDRADVVRLSALKSLQRQVEEEINRFAVYADTEISRAATAAVQAGLTDSRALAASAMGSAQGQRALIAGWDMLPTESVETMLGFLGDDSPLHSALVNRLGPAVAERMGNALVDGIVLGMNPRQVAKIVQKELGVGLTWAMTTARTAQLYAYREASRANYVANSHIVEGWTWFAALDSRVCLSCVNQHGSFHPVTETLNDHHNGRCVALPEIKQAKAFGLPQPEIEPGEQWFNRQTEATQRGMMGPGMFDAWKKGKFAFGDLSQPYSDPVYGEMLREASLKGLLSGSNGRRPTFVKPVRVVTPTYYNAGEVRNFIGRDGKRQDNSWIIGQIGDTNLVYRDMSFTGNPPSAALLEKYQEQSKAIVEAAVERLPQSDKRLIRNIFVEEMKGTPNPFAGAAGASGDNIFITSHGGEWQVGPGGIVHEVGHLASFGLTEGDAATWLRATGWDGDYTDPLKVLREATPNNIEWYKYKAVTEYGTVHPGESFAEAYRLAYASDVNLWKDTGDWDKYEDQIPILTSLIKGFAR